MNVLLLNPPPNDRSWYRVEHLGIAYLAAVLRQAGHTVHLLDSLLENLDVEQTYQTIKRRFGQIDVIGITATESETIKSGVAVVGKLKSYGLDAHVTSGGYLPTFWSDELLREYPEVDSVVVGEGEETLRDLVQALQQQTDLESVPGLVFRSKAGEIVHNPPRRLIQDLDQLPFPARDYLAIAYQKYHHALVYASRGCYHRCSFCQIAQFYRLSSGSPYRSRSAKNIADEIEILVNEHGVRSIFFADDEFITESLQRKRIIEELIEEIRKRKLEFSFSIQYRADTGANEPLLRALRDVGLRTVFIGVESGVDSVLERFDKGTTKTDIQKTLQIVQDLDLSANIGYMLYNPDTTFEELKQSVEYLLSPEAPTILKLIGMMILKGTPEEENARQRNLASESNFGIRYQITDRRIAKFADLLRLYYPIYEPVARDYYELHFMIGDLAPIEGAAVLKTIRRIGQTIRSLHQQFLSKAIVEISKGKPAALDWMDELGGAYKSLSLETQQLLVDGRAAIVHSCPETVIS